jgi:tRNA (cmo5U34)-methyltransferase
MIAGGGWNIPTRVGLRAREQDVRRRDAAGGGRRRLGHVAQFHFTPDRYCEWIRADVPRYDELQDEVAAATADVDARRILDLGVGTGETARRVLDRHPDAQLVGIDASAEMLAAADVAGDLRVGRLEDPLPDGPFDLVVSALAVHHLDAAGKRDLFVRVSQALAARGSFVLGDVVIADEAVTPITPDFDRPERVDDLISWLADAGFAPRVTWSWKDLAVIAADRAA